MSIGWPVATFVVTTFVAGAAVRLFDPSVSADVPSLLWLAPAIGAAATWLVGRQALATLLPAPVPRRQFVAHTILGIGAAVVLVVLAIVGVALVPAAAAERAASAGSPWLLALVAVPTAFALELGWRGTLQPLVESRLGRVWGCVAVGLVWALWRLDAGAGIGVLGTVVASVALSLLLGHLAGGGAWWQRWATAAVAQSIVTLALPFAVGTGPWGVGGLVVAGAATVTTIVWLAMFRAARRRRAARAAAGS